MNLIEIHDINNGKSSLWINILIIEYIMKTNLGAKIFLTTGKEIETTEFPVDIKNLIEAKCEKFLPS